jgi:hypothetical protein
LPSALPKARPVKVKATVEQATVTKSGMSGTPSDGRENPKPSARRPWARRVDLRRFEGETGNRPRAGCFGRPRTRPRMVASSRRIITSQASADPSQCVRRGRGFQDHMCGAVVSGAGGLAYVGRTRRGKERFVRHERRHESTGSRNRSLGGLIAVEIAAVSRTTTRKSAWL